MAYRFSAEIWMAPAQAAWYFLTLPHDVADDIDRRTEPTRKPGFGSVRVTATIGATTWATSVFPDAKLQSYVLPVKKQVRLAERLDDGSTAEVILTLADR